MVTVTGTDVAVLPDVSRATAVIVWDPLALDAVAQLTEYGLVVFFRADIGPVDLDLHPGYDDVVGGTHRDGDRYTVAPTAGAVMLTVAGWCRVPW